MTISRRHLNALLAGAPLAAALPQALAQSRKDSVVLGMVLEPTTLDPPPRPQPPLARSSTTTSLKA